MAGTATKLHVLDCGSMSCDLTWLLLKPGRSIRPRAERDKPVEWYPCTTHAVVVETPEGTMLWDTSCPRDWEERWVPTGLHEFFPYDRVTEEQYLDQRLAQLGLGPEQLDYVVFSPSASRACSPAPTSRPTTRGWTSRPCPATPSSCPG
jgi:N-acyl homoserine lactone hydrolase